MKGRRAMAGDDVRERVRDDQAAGTSLLARIEAGGRAAIELPERGLDGRAEEFELLPKAGDDYKAHSRPSNKPGTTLHIMLKDGTYDGFPWAGLDRIRLMRSEKTGGGMALVLTFAGARVLDVTISGRNLGYLHALLGQHRLAWIRELPSGIDFQDDAVIVITRIEIQPATA